MSLETDAKTQIPVLAPVLYVDTRVGYLDDATHVKWDIWLMFVGCLAEAPGIFG